MLPETLEVEVGLEERLSEVRQAILDWAENLRNFEESRPINPAHDRGNIIKRFKDINDSKLTEEQRDIREKISGTNPGNVMPRDPDYIKEQAEIFFPIES